MKKLLPKRLLFILPEAVAYILTKYAQNHQNWAEQRSQTPSTNPIEKRQDKDAYAHREISAQASLSCRFSK